MLLLHSEEAGFPDMLQKLHAMAYAQGHMYPTVGALQAAVPGAQSLSADTVTKVLAKWSDDRNRAFRERVGSPDEGDMNGHERTSSDNVRRRCRAPHRPARTGHGKFAAGRHEAVPEVG